MFDLFSIVLEAARPRKYPPIPQAMVDTRAGINGAKAVINNPQIVNQWFPIGEKLLRYEKQSQSWFQQRVP